MEDQWEMESGEDRERKEVKEGVNACFRGGIRSI
jgi:hypothetical protein